MPEPLFLLCSPQSHGSLICAMLGQHPECYGLPQLNLFVADRLGAAWDALAKNPPGGRDGLLRAVAEVNDNAQTDEAIEAAKRWIETRRHWRVRQVFDHIQDRVAARMMVEYSATTAQRFENIERIYACFPHASYLHVTCHPRAMGRAMAAADSGADPDQAWHTVQQNILDFAGVLPTGQVMTIRVEDLFSDPDMYLPQIAVWLGISNKPAAIKAMQHPDKSRFAKAGPALAACGSDPDFLATPKLDRERVRGDERLGITGELEWKPGVMFSKPTQKLARQLGYQ